MAKQKELDEFDFKILKIIQCNNRQPLERIAKEVRLSSSAVQRRLSRLRKIGIIQSEVAVLSPDALGRKLIAIVEVTLEREQPNILEEFKRRMVATSEVMQCYYVTGDADFIVIITAKDMQEFDGLTTTLFSENPSVKRFTTSMVVKTVKAGLMIPLGPRAAGG